MFFLEAFGKPGWELGKRIWSKRQAVKETEESLWTYGNILIIFFHMFIQQNHYIMCNGDGRMVIASTGSAESSLLTHV